MIDIPTAIKNLGITEWVLYGDPTSEEEFNSMFRKIVGVNENGTAKKSEDPKDFGITWSEVKAKQVELQAEHDAQEYARTRATLYPAIGDQLDDLYKKGAFSDEMAAKIKKVKDDNPKPS